MTFHNDSFINDLLTGLYVDNKVKSDYLKKIGSFSVEQLIKEPNRLKDDKDQLQKQTQELAFQNYKTFIQTADCSRELFKRFNATEDSIDNLLQLLPGLRTDCQTVAKVSQQVEARKKTNSQLLSRTGQLLSILELPQLMDSCIRNGQFDEALELFSYIRRLGSKHGKIPIIASIVMDLEGSWRGMVQQLLAQLRSDLPLPKCLQIIGFLRRMDVYSDPELRLKFLQARDSWLKNLLTSVNVDPGESLSLKKLEVLRVHLFNIVTQHRAIFSDEEISLQTPDSVNEPCIFYSWLSDKLSLILGVVDEGTSGKQGTNLESLLGQAMYFGLSFSRVGADFRGLVALRLHKAALTSAETGLRRAARKFEQDMDRYVLSPGYAIFPPAPTTTDGPPLVLLEFPPLAELTNAILRIFNELRGCAPLSIAHGLTLALRETLKSCSKTILGFYRQEQTAIGPEERQTLGRFCESYQSLISYLAKCLSLIFPLTDLALHLGLPVHQLQSLELVSLKEETFMESLSHLLPRVEVTQVPAETFLTS